MSALFLTNDLLFSSKVSGAAAAHKLPLEIAMSVPKLLDRAAAPGVQLVILDLAFHGCDPAQLVPQLRQLAPAAKIIAYGPHVQDAQLLAAQSAGCDEVLTRGQFSMEAAGILRRYLGAGFSA